MSGDLSAVVVAAGRSRRFNQSIQSERTGESASRILSKQLLEWNGKPLFVHSIEALRVLPVSEWAIVISRDEEGAIHEAVRKFLPDLKLKIIFGGERRQDSVRNGLLGLNRSERVLVHDAARPFVSPPMLTRLNDASKTEQAVIPAVAVVETLKEINHQGRVIKTHDRNRFVRIQTPQFFNFDLLKEAHEKFANDTTEFTDDAMMMEALGVAVQTVTGDVENIKITTVEDLRLKGIHV